MYIHVAIASCRGCTLVLFFSFCALQAQQLTEGDVDKKIGNLLYHLATRFVCNSLIVV